MLDRVQTFIRSPLNQRRWSSFKANKRGYWSLWVFLSLFVVSLFAEVIANDRPIIMRYKGELLFPVLVDYPEEKFGGFLARTNYKNPAIYDEITKGDNWAIWPLIRFNGTDSTNNDYPLRKSPDGLCLGFPAPPFWASKLPLCEAPTDQMARYDILSNRNWLGTDDSGRDVLARIIYGFRISVFFGILLTILSSIIGV
ncbi:MAG TPA: ABC transporter permease, partial [Hyphomicrobiaceae bacterium]|nr:ABC transporter permease [Hyphomicrobiaceae bacterium]